jgi:hypothetical protein
VVAELVRSADASHATLGTFTATALPGPGGARAGVKRPRVQLKFTLDKARVLEVAGADALTRVPCRYTAVLDAPAGARVMTRLHAATGAPEQSASGGGAGGGAGVGAGAAGGAGGLLLAPPPLDPDAGPDGAGGGGFAFLGVASRSGNMVPDPTDPAYGPYVSHRRARERESVAARSTTRLADDPAALGALAARAGAGGDLSASGLLMVEPTRGATAAAVARPVPRVSTVFALFEAGAYWTLREVMEAVGRKEVRLWCAGGGVRCCLRKWRRLPTHGRSWRSHGCATILNCPTPPPLPPLLFCNRRRKSSRT